jgi:membrane-associated phospholipid phosphatase
MNLRAWLVSFFAVGAVIIAAVLWLDRPIALFVHENFRYAHRTVVDELSRFPNPLVILAALLSIFFGVRIAFGRRLSSHQANTLVCSLAVLFSEVIKDVLKFIFGRTWPETWTRNNPSFIRDGAYGFHFMHWGSAYQSFPSGHMAAMCTVIGIVWIRYPNIRWLCLIAGLSVAVGLIGENYHFLSDVIAGGFVGLTIGWVATVAWDKYAT